MGPYTLKRPDPRRQVGSVVYAKAFHVTCASECQRRYGSEWKNKEVCGLVTCVSIESNEKTNRQSTFVIAEFDFGNGDKKSTRLNIRSVRSTPSSSSFDDSKVQQAHPVLNSQKLPPTTVAAIPTPTTQGQTTNNNPFILEIHPSPESEVTMPTLGGSTAYGTVTTVGTAELQPETTKTHQVINEPTIKPPPAHQQETTFQASITEEPVQAIQ